MNFVNSGRPALKIYQFEAATEQRIPGTVEAASEEAARALIEAGEADYGDIYFAPTKIDWLKEKEAQE